MSRCKSLLGRFCSVAALCLLFAGCKGASPLTVFVHDTTYLNKEVHDSMFVDRWHTEYQKGDTVYIHDSIDRWHEKKVYDTVRLSKDVPKPYPVEKIVEKELAWWQKTFMWAGVIGIVALVVWVVLKLKPIKK